MEGKPAVRERPKNVRPKVLQALMGFAAAAGSFFEPFQERIEMHPAL